MGYNREDYIRIKAEYLNKYKKAWQAADLRREELHAAIPDVRAIDAMLSGTGSEIMNIILQGKDGVEEKIEALKQRNVKLQQRRAELLRAAGYPEDYSDVRYECEKCNDSGYTDEKMCECMKKRLVLAGYESSGIGGLIKTQSFDNFSLDYYRESGANFESMQMVLAWVRDFANNFGADTYRNLLFVGGTGLGKTHLSTAVARTVIDKGYDVLYVSAVGMMTEFENKRFGNGEKTKNTDRYYDADLLVIDDFGTELVNNFTRSYIYDVINTRINTRKSTLINTNLSRKELEEKYEERITSRLFGEYFPIIFKGTDIRKQKLRK